MKDILKTYPLVYVLTFITLLSNCSKKLDNDFILASFSGGDIRLNEYLDHYLLSTKRKPKELPTEENLIKIVSDKAIEKIALQDAKDKRIYNNPSFLKKLNHSQNKVLFYRYMRMEIIDAVITDSLIERFYSEYSPQYNMRYILRPFFEKSKQEFKNSQKDSIHFIYTLLQDGHPFHDVAKQYSQDIASNKKGGDLGYLIKESIGDAIIRTVMDTLKDDSYSNPFLGVAGFYILYKGEKRIVSIPPFDEVKNKIWKTLYRTRRHYIKEKAQLRFIQIAPTFSYQENEKIIDMIISQSQNNLVYKAFLLKNIPDELLNETVATFNSDTLYLKDIYENKKKRPTDKFDFRLRVDALAQEKLFSLHARELKIHKENDVENELQNIYDTLLKNELFYQEVKINADEKIESISDEEINQLSRFEKRRLHLDTEKEFKQILESELKNKYKYKINSHEIERALKVAMDKKNLQNKQNTPVH